MVNAFIRRLQSIAPLQEADRWIVEDICQNSHHISAKHYISREGNGMAFFPVVMEGWAARFQLLRDGGRQITQLLLPGDALYFGSIAGGAAVDDVVTLSDCRIVEIPHADMEHAIDISPAICQAMRNYGCMENAILASWAVNLGRRDALERMAHLICEIHFRLSLNGDLPSNNEFAFPLTQDDFADLLGLTPVHINRKLQQLRHSDLISLGSGPIKALA